MSRPSALVVAKAPVPGVAKTRVAAEVGDETAAELAAASLLDTLETVLRTDLVPVVALTGDLDLAARAGEIRATLSACVVVPQVGASFGARLARAHLDADRGLGVVQIGMDSPQVQAGDLTTAADLLADHASVLGPAEDGGWWLLAVRRGADAAGLAAVEMSSPATGAHTRDALPGPVATLRTLRDVDTWADAVEVAGAVPGSRFAAAVEAVTTRRPA